MELFSELINLGSEDSINKIYKKEHFYNNNNIRNVKQQLLFRTLYHYNLFEKLT